MKLLLNQARNVESDKSSMTIPIEIKANREIIVDDQFEEVVNQYNVYLDEREQCTTIRLTANVNIIASNIVFNSVTEIVKYEGSNECICINLNPRTIDSTYGKPTSFLWGDDISAAVMDTQLSYAGDNDKNYTYLCGIDIFNNHILRAKTLYPIYDKRDRGEEYNTIRDFIRDDFGTKNNKLSTFYIRTRAFLPDDTRIHRYTKSNIMTFEESLQNNLINNDGWVGFYNKGLMPFKYAEKDFGIENVINNETRNKFIDLFPGRDRYSFLPHYNKYRKRYEKNWEYCLTYPCDSTIENIPFINKSLDTLKIAFIDETEPNDDSVYRCTIYTVSKHGLNVDDTINLYRSKDGDDNESEVVEENLIVDEVIDDYTFTVYTSDWVCKKWLSILDKKGLEYYNITHVISGVYEINVHGFKKTLTSVNNYLNIDFDTNDSIGSQNLSFAKVENGIQCRYYVRIFSRFPNFDFYDKEVTEENIYSKESGSTNNIVDVYSDIRFEKQSTETKLGFAKNAYGDNVGQIVFNDDIDIKYIKDNLGRPLTSLYLTFFKTNYGRKEWYGMNNVKSENVEWSRCFGKLNCGFEYSPYIDGDVWGRGNINTMNNVNNIFGLKEEGVFYDDDGEDYDEIIYKKQNRFYGDLCMYSPSQCLETVIQDCCHRFNTMQREVGGKPLVYGTYSKFNLVYKDDIISDDYTPGALFNVTHDKYETSGSTHPEGSYYHPNYEIPIRSFSSDLREFNPKMIDVVEFTSVNDDIIQAKTVIENYFNNDTNLYLYDGKTGKDYQCEILNILDVNIVEFKCTEYTGQLESGTCKLYNKNVVIPPYAEMVPGKTGLYRWRDIVENGFGNDNGVVKEYPFVNGCFYINKDINIFLRRQDPFGEYGLSSSAVYFGLPQITGERNPVEDGTAANANDAIKESDIRC